LNPGIGTDPERRQRSEHVHPTLEELQSDPPEHILRLTDHHINTNFKRRTSDI
jgi:hypothetical protein